MATEAILAEDRQHIAAKIDTSGALGGTLSRKAGNEHANPPDRSNDLARMREIQARYRTSVSILRTESVYSNGFRLLGTHFSLARPGTLPRILRLLVTRFTPDLSQTHGMEINRVKQAWIQWITRIVVIAVAIIMLAAVVGWMLRGRIEETVRRRAAAGLEQAFAGRLEWKSFQVGLVPRLQVNILGLVLHFEGRNDQPPLISIRKLSATSDLSALLRRHIQYVRLEGLEIQVPPKSQRTPQQGDSVPRAARDFLIDEIVADGTVLKVALQNQSKEPLVWDIRRLTLYHVGSTTPMSFQATLRNAMPPGEIQTAGHFGPWQSHAPRETSVSGSYTFQNADLAVFKGIRGILASQGSYRGRLERIDVQGSTDTPDFMLKVSGNPVHLTTRFHSVVDGTDGNTWLQPVDAQLGNSPLTAKGAIIRSKGARGRTLDLQVAIRNGRLEDLLRLGVKGPAVTMTGGISFEARLLIPPGPASVDQKMRLDGRFIIASARFSHSDIQEKVNQLSHRGEGEPKTPPTENVASDFAGSFRLKNGVIRFRTLSFRIPGVRVDLDGQYQLAGQAMDFSGTARLEAKLSQTTTGFKSFLLKAIDPFFEKRGAGAVLPISVTGTVSKPSFGLKLHGGKSPHQSG
ncbi:MAG TPA: hypothetical protein VMH80_05400 [Bryobacteraceae bacterium]|nr:hypothetical protein [Bryobacteraceae bacterium]